MIPDDLWKNADSKLRIRIAIPEHVIKSLVVIRHAKKLSIFVSYQSDNELLSKNMKQHNIV